MFIVRVLGRTSAMMGPFSRRMSTLEDIFEGFGVGVGVGFGAGEPGSIWFRNSCWLWSQFCTLLLSGCRPCRRPGTSTYGRARRLR